MQIVFIILIKAYKPLTAYYQKRKLLHKMFAEIIMHRYKRNDKKIKLATIMKKVYTYVYSVPSLLRGSPTTDSLHRGICQLYYFFIILIILLFLIIVFCLVATSLHCK